MPPRESSRNKDNVRRKAYDDAEEEEEEEEEVEEEEEEQPKKKRKSGGGGGAASAAKKAAKGEPEEPDSLRGLDAVTMFHPSKTAEQFADFVARAAYDAPEVEDKKRKGPPKVPPTARENTFSISDGMRKKWGELDKVEKAKAYQVVKDVARALVLDAHAGGGGVESSKILGMIRLRDVESKFSKCVEGAFERAHARSSARAAYAHTTLTRAFPAAALPPL